MSDTMNAKQDAREDDYNPDLEDSYPGPLAAFPYYHPSPLSLYPLSEPILVPGYAAYSSLLSLMPYIPIVQIDPSSSRLPILHAAQALALCVLHNHLNL
ncbi:hypothetical protein D9758_008743 [Tetrapyrgos nigripes]|uniref:Uncharacterized protein n=1 Tax=Tetrapyrgos nigripes TaxID=182062 RepID=A0A8H5D5H8_9AGAR|nr:hypothetical protein D9758_008743 [Tetrapyrgos nigripes]